MSIVEASIPEGLELMETAEGLTIRRTWMNWRIAPMALFAVVWDCFLVFWYHQVLSKPNPPLIAVLFPIGHVAVGISITYYVIASFVNKTDVIISSLGVRTISSPFPWFGNRGVSRVDITEVKARERVGSRGSRSYSVVYVNGERKEKTLVSSLAQDDQAEFMAITIRTALNLKTQDA
jgi:hypothetical protein